MGATVSTPITPAEKQFGLWIVALWTIVPPLYFWADWVYLCRPVPKDGRAQGANQTGVGEKDKLAFLDDVKTMHDFSRNIWLALVAVLTVMFQVKLF